MSLPRTSMQPAPVAVHPWPAARPWLAAAPEAWPDVLVISVATPDTALREAARAQLRGAVREVLALRLACAPEAISLVCRPGQAMRVELPGHAIGLSASHEPGLSVAAISRDGPVGIDIMRLPQAFEWQPVARDYLGLQTLATLACLPEHEQLAAFAREWTRLEAALKCLHVGLQEWSAARERQVRACRIAGLELPAGLVGTLACAPTAAH